MKLGLVLLQLLGASSMLAWLSGLLMLPMAFDAPDSTSNATTYLCVVGFLSYPLLLGGLYYFAWKIFEENKIGLAYALSSLPIIACIVAIFYLFL